MKKNSLKPFPKQMKNTSINSISTFHKSLSKTLFLLSISNVVACGDAIQQSPPVIDSAFDSYVNKFESKIKKKVNINVRFAPQEAPTVGVCITYSTGQREIEIDQAYWEGASDAHKEVLMFHEFGHCILGRDHDTSLLGSYFMPKSIMYPYIFGNKYLEQENYYLNELKNPGKDWTFLIQ